MRNVQKIFDRKSQEKYHLVDLDVVGKRILKCIKLGMKVCGLDSRGSGRGSVSDSCEHGNELSGSINGGQFLGQLRKYEPSRIALIHGARTFHERQDSVLYFNFKCQSN
jgi:hypothetical protein